MRILLLAAVLLFSFSSFSQKTKILPKKYPSLFWEISGHGLSKPSYLFGTMHVSSKMAFHLSDSFYLGIKNADVVALETDLGTWNEDFSRYELDYSGYANDLWRRRSGIDYPGDYLTVRSLRFPSYDKLIEAVLYNNPAMINNFLYRNNSDEGSDFEEDTYLDLHIYQAGKKWGKRVCGVENFDRSMELMKEAYMDAAREKNKKERAFDVDAELSYNNLEFAYRSGNLDLLDSINKVNSTSAAFDEKFLYRRNEIQAVSIDSILSSKSRLFAGVGAAHLPGERGVIELLRKKGYRLRPIHMNERDGLQKEAVEKIRVPVHFSRQTAEDGLFSVSVPGKLYALGNARSVMKEVQYADMSNGSYYMVTRVGTGMIPWGQDEAMVLRKIDSVIYESIPGKILSKQAITRNGYKGYAVLNRTRRGDDQRYNIFVTPFEIVVFKMSGNGDYVKNGKEADQFFNSIELRPYKTEWNKWSPSFGGFEVLFPHQPFVGRNDYWQFAALDPATGTGFEVVRTDIHNYEFVEEDSFDLSLMEESFASSEFIDRQLSRKLTRAGGYPALETSYRYKDGSFALVKFIIQGTHYYTLLAHARSENEKMRQFLQSFSIKPFVYGTPMKQTDTALHFSILSPVLIEKAKKLSMYPENMRDPDEEEVLPGDEVYKGKLITSDSTGEKIYVSFYQPAPYYVDRDSLTIDTLHFRTEKMNWLYRSRKVSVLPDKTRMLEYSLGDPNSSRCVNGKLYSKDGIALRLETEGDTLSAPSAFVATAFTSFSPLEKMNGVSQREKKSTVFFSDFFSSDTVLHKRAVRYIGKMTFDSADLKPLQHAIGTLQWKEKKYVNVKTSLIAALSSVRTTASADYLKEVYHAGTDTLDFQYAALQALLRQKTRYAYAVFRDILVSDPPVLNTEGEKPLYRRGKMGPAGVSKKMFDVYNTGGRDAADASFFDELSDSLALTQTIIKDLLPLVNVHDYEQPMMELMKQLVDSGFLKGEDYSIYKTKFLVEGRQLLKKQLISEKNKSIQKAQVASDEENDFRSTSDNDGGNSQLSLYAVLLMPFYEKEPAVSQFIGQLLGSTDKELTYTTTILLLRQNRQVPDTLLHYFARLDAYRYPLYTDLEKMRRPDLYPLAYNPVELAKSKLLNLRSGYGRPDSIEYIDKLPATVDGKTGLVYFFKHRQKRETSWKLAAVGIVPARGKFEFDTNREYREDEKSELTQLSTSKLDPQEDTRQQLKKFLKKLEYAKRNSSEIFYGDSNEED